VCSKFLKTSTDGSALNGLLTCGTLQGAGGVDESIQGIDNVRFMSLLKRKSRLKL
jgi:hypothetical protein